MIFSSITFLYYFLPWVLVLYFAVPFKYKNFVLLLSSLLFYAWGEPKIVFIMLATITVSYVLGILTEKHEDKKKFYMFLAVLLSLGSLGYFKYADFFIENINAITGLSIPMLKIALPVGISFYTFQVLSYNIDVYRGNISAFLESRRQNADKKLVYTVHTSRKKRHKSNGCNSGTAVNKAQHKCAQERRNKEDECCLRFASDLLSQLFR